MSKIDMVLAEGIDIRWSDREEILKDCIKHRLYSPGGMMLDQYKGLLDGSFSKRSRRVMVLYRDDAPVGVILGAKQYIMVYVRPASRRCGFGAYLVSMYLRKYRLNTVNLRAMAGVHGSATLYFNCGIRRAEDLMDFYRAFDYQVHTPIRLSKEIPA